MKTFKEFIIEASESVEQAFYNRIYRQAKSAGDRFPHLTAAQASLESDYGRSPSGRNNYFGQKSSSGTVRGTQEYGGGGMYGTSATFADYDDEEEGTRNRVRTWGYKYGDAKDEVEAARNLQLPGGAKIPGSKETSHGVYATDPDYVDKLSRIMSDYRSGIGDDSSSYSKPSTSSRTFTRNVISDPGGAGGTVSTHTAYKSKIGGVKSTSTRGETGNVVIRANLGNQGKKVKDQKVSATLGGVKGTLEIKNNKRTFIATKKINFKDQTT